MPVALPMERTAEWRCAFVTTVFGGTIPEEWALVPEGSDISDWTLNVRLLLYCGPIDEEDFAAHVGRLYEGTPSTLLGAIHAAAGNLKLYQAEALLGHVGLSCWNPACRRRAPVELPADVEACVRGRGRPRRFQECSVCNFAHYCGRRCQVADWRRHRRMRPSI